MSDASLTRAKPCDTPMEQNVRLTTAEYDVVTKNFESLDKLLLDANKYRRLIGRLVYLTTTRPDICYSIQNLSQFMHAPKISHMESAVRVLKYLKSTPGLGILLSSNGPFYLSAFCDSDWATFPMTRRSVTGYCIKLRDSLLSWKTKKQNFVSRSLTEAEYRAMSVTVCEITWIVGVALMQPTILYCDNKAAMHIASNSMYHERTKHIEVDCHRGRLPSNQIKDS